MSDARYPLTSGIAITAVFVGFFIPVFGVILALMSFADINDGLRRGRGIAGFALGWGVLFGLGQVALLALTIWGGFNLLATLSGLVPPVVPAVPPVVLG